MITLLLEGYLWYLLLYNFECVFECNMLHHNLLCNMHNDINFNTNDIDYANNNMNLMLFCDLFHVI